MNTLQRETLFLHLQLLTKMKIPLACPILPEKKHRVFLPKGQYTGMYC